MYLMYKEVGKNCKSFTKVRILTRLQKWKKVSFCNKYIQSPTLTKTFFEDIVKRQHMVLITISLLERVETVGDETKELNLSVRLIIVCDGSPSGEKIM